MRLTYTVILQAYIKQLEDNPLRTKMLTAGTLAGAQELIASWLAKDRNKHGNYFTSRVPKMATYGALVSAPLGHFLIWALQKTFKDRTSLRSKIMQILVSNLVVCLPKLLSPEIIIVDQESPLTLRDTHRLHQFKTQCTWSPWRSSLARGRSIKYAPPSRSAFGR